MTIKLTPFKKVSLKNSSFDEKWIQERIADDPSILGLGDLVLNACAGANFTRIQDVINNSNKRKV